MATLIWNEDFETNAIGTIFSGGNASIDTVVFKTGAKSGKFSGDPGYGLRNWTAGPITVFKAWIRLASIPSQGIELMTLNGGPRFGYDIASNKFGWINGTAQVMDRLSAVTPVAGQWYLLEFRVNQSANPWVIDYQIDGVPQTQITYAVAASTVNAIYLGHTTGFSVFVTLNCDDVQASQTAADYPLSVVSNTVVSPAAAFTARSVAPGVSADWQVAAPAAAFTGSSVGPTLFIGTSNTVVAPPATFTGSAVAPTLIVSVTISAPAATFNASSVAPLVSRTGLVIAPPAIFTSTAVAPPVSGSGNVSASPATTSFTSVAPIPTVSLTISAPPATFSASSVSPFLGQSRIITPPAGIWTATAVAPVIGNTVTTTWLTISNGTFETDVSGWTTAGGYFNNSGATLARDATTAHSGVASMLMTTDGVSASEGCRFSINIAAGVTYLFSAWLKGTGQVKLAAGGGGFTPVAGPTITLTPAWTMYTFAWTPTASGLTNFTIVQVGQGVISVNIDDVSVAQNVFASIAPTLSVAVAVQATPALVTFSSVAPAINFPSTITASPAVATFTAISAGLSLGGGVVPNAATTTFSSVAPILQVPNTIVSPVAIFSATAVPPVPSGAGAVAVPPAVWTATVVAPSLSRIATVPAGVFTAVVIAGNPSLTIPVPFATMTTVSTPPAIAFGASVTIAALTVTMAAVAPTLLAGQGAILTPQAAIWTATGVGPFIFIHSFYPAPPALATFTSAAPGVIAGSGTIVVVPAATASYAAAAPIVVIPGGVTVPPALLTMSAPIPSPGIGESVTVPAGASTFVIVSPVINTGTIVGAPAGAWQATSATPQVAIRLAAPAGVVAYTSTAPTGGVFQFVIAPIGKATFRSVAPLIIGVSVGTEFTYTPGSIWQHSMTSGDAMQPQTGRIVQTYERF